ncbi:hypothetical protein [Croceicoccus mobilis]|uniref:Secreted protein n=1 Tax=Croceicoccus mobilis TaxID=1703339 RepID=A0A917DV20_9SPHN|nr:hypothetical protein [Croceicoccus mobilis]GGD73304.1 hypothetical protein GCM10010990_23640 [Croceicoccus mobilis]
MNPRLFALLALFPALTGPLPASAKGGPSIIVALCNGGSIEIPLGDDDEGGDNAPCHPQGCHGTSCRKRFDPAQGPESEPLE